MFSNWSLKRKLITVFAVVCTASLAGGLEVYRELKELDEIVVQRGRYFNAILTNRDLRIQFLELGSVAKKIETNPQSAEIRNLGLKSEREARAMVAELGAKKSQALSGLNGSSEVNSLLVAAESAIDAFKSYIDTPNERRQELSAVLKNFESSLTVVTNQNDRIISILQESLNELKPQLDAVRKKIFMVSVFSTSITLMLLLALALPIILRSLAALDRVRSELARTIGEIGATGNSLATVTSSMASATTESAAAIQESVSAMTEMSSMIAQTVSHTGTASALSSRLLEKTGEGSRTMGDMESSMNAISQANTNLREITKIIEDISAKTAVINEIVFKTQLLAVNASIEAARAGVHGKGFAVVAGEVSNLATMSGQAAAQIRDLLSQSTTKVVSIIDETGSNVRQGEQVCLKATKLFEEISSALEEMTEKVQQINEAAREQDIGVKQTTQAIDQLSQATSINTGVAQENTAMCGSLQGQARKLTRVGLALNVMLTGHEQGEKRKEAESTIDNLLSGTESNGKALDSSATVAPNEESGGAAERRSSKRSAQAVIRKFRQPPAGQDYDHLDKSA